MGAARRFPASLADGGEATVLRVRLLARRKALHEVNVLLVGSRLRTSAWSSLFGEAYVPAQVARRHPGGVVILQNHLDEDALAIHAAAFLKCHVQRKRTLNV